MRDSHTLDRTVSRGAFWSAIGPGLYGLLYHVLLAGVMVGSVPTAETGGYAEALGMFLVVAVTSVAVHLGRASATTGED